MLQLLRIWTSCLLGYSEPPAKEAKIRAEAKPEVEAKAKMGAEAKPEAEKEKRGNKAN